MSLVKIIKNWKEPNLLRQTPQSKGVWGSVEFTLDDVDECDYLLVLNYLPNTTKIRMNPENVWALMQEPYLESIFPWVEKGHDSFKKVFTHHLFNKNKKKYIGTQTCLPWHVNKTYDELMLLGIPIKTKKISCILSNKTVFPGHKKRMHFYGKIVNEEKLNIDFFGRGINEIKDKYDALAPYQYSIAIENSRTEHYWTEKIADCFLTYTVPIYYGCTNLKDYFPEKSFIQIDIDDFQNSYEIISRTLAEDVWEERLDAIQEARELILNKYQLFPFFSDVIENSLQKKQKKEILFLDKVIK